MSFNVQTAKELTITEGDVRTIHDSDGNQLWGRLAYSTSYDGDTTQQTYSGKNLFNRDVTPAGTWQLTKVDYQNGIKLTSTSNSGVCYVNYKFPFVPTQQTDIYFSFIKTGTGFVNIYFRDADNNAVKSISNKDSSFALTGIPTTVVKCDLYFYGDTSATGSVTIFDDIQLEIGTSVSSFEPYTGSVYPTIVPSPNPDYPQTVNVVTGTQTVTITADDQQSEDFAVSLGSLELCKIGTYQDYIYKSGDDWYLHKEVVKHLYNGSEPWFIESVGGYSGKRVDLTVDDNYIGSGRQPIISNYFRFVASDHTYGGGFTSGSILYLYPDTSFTEVTQWTTWLTSHNTTVYYVLRTSTDTQITDNTLIGQLDAIHEWLIRYGYNATVSGNLPLVINQTNLS